MDGQRPQAQKQRRRRQQQRRRGWRRARCVGRRAHGRRRRRHGATGRLSSRGRHYRSQRGGGGRSGRQRRRAAAPAAKLGARGACGSPSRPCSIARRAPLTRPRAPAPTAGRHVTPARAPRRGAEAGATPPAAPRARIAPAYCLVAARHIALSQPLHYTPMRSRGAAPQALRTGNAVHLMLRAALAEPAPVR